MKSSPLPVDLTRLKVFPLAERKSMSRVEDVLQDVDAAPPACPAPMLDVIRDCARKIAAARRADAAVILMFGAHLVKNGGAAILARLIQRGHNPRDIKVLLAQEIVARFHSQKAAEDALAEFEARFQKGVLPDDMPEIAVPSTDGHIGIAQLLKQAGLVASTSEALRMIDQGGVKLDGEKVSDKALQLKAGAVVVAQVGKRKFGRVSVN